MDKRRYPLGGLLAAIAITALATYFIIKTFGLAAPPPDPECCSAQGTCDIAAPQNLTAGVIGGDSVIVSWAAVSSPDLKHYLVRVFDVENNQLLFSDITTNTTIGFSSGAVLPPASTIRASVGAVCENCQVSTAEALTALCDIVIEDIVMLMPTCADDGCNCNPNTPVSINPATGEYPIDPANVGLYRIKIDQGGGRIGWFVVQTDPRTPGKLIVNRPDYAAIKAWCSTANPELNCGNFDAPHVSGNCGEMKNKDGFDYSIQFSLSGFKLSSTAGTIYTVLKCTGCP